MFGAVDGLGWLLEKRCRLMRFYGWSEDYVRKKLPGNRGWAYNNWAQEHEVSVFGGSLHRKSPGYIRQERDLWLKAK